MNTIFKAIVCLIFLVSVFNLNAQEDKISGIYVDGVKVTDIDCYSFSEMEVIFPIDKLKGFDLIQIGFKPVIENANIEEDGLAAYQFCELSYSALALKSFSSSGITYSRIKIYEKGLEESKLVSLHEDRKYSTSRSQFFVRKNAVKKRSVEVTISGKTINGMNESYDQSCSCIKKTPTYSTSEYLVFKTEMKPNTNGNEEPVKKKAKFKLAILSNPSEDKYTREKFAINYNLACPVKGQKLEDLLKSETKATPSNTNNTSTNALTPVTEKHKNGKVKVQGQNNKDGYQEGTWKYFNELGKLEKVENYKNGVSHGEWKYYDVKTGKVTKTEKYNEGELIE